MKTDVELKLEYAIKHVPIRYFVKPYLIFFWTIYDISGDQIGMYFWNHYRAAAVCKFLNSNYALGYNRGQLSVIKILLSK
jgi:hypothetical protein